MMMMIGFSTEQSFVSDGHCLQRSRAVQFAFLPNHTKPSTTYMSHDI